MQDRVPSRELLRAKLSRPIITQSVVRRDLLHARLRAGLNKPLTLVSAPPGYGKTTLLVDWLAKSGLPAAWLSLDRGESDLPSFVVDVAAAIRIPFPDSCSRTLRLAQAPQPPPAETLAIAFSNDLEALGNAADSGAPWPLILVLEDYHLAESQATDDFLAGLLEHPPSALHLVISTRRDPALPMSRLRANNKVSEIRARDLRFNAAEVADFMRDALGRSLSDSQIALLADRTDGWAAGLRLAALSLSTSDDIESDIVALDGSNRDIMDYLLNEVLAQLPEATQEFLLKTAVLDRLSGSLCGAVAGLNSAQGQTALEWLQQANLFTFAQDPQGKWYRYHHLFQTLLLKRLERAYDAEQIAGLHGRASAWYAANGYVEDAIVHALRAGDEPAAIGMIQAHRHPAMNRERWLDLQRWLNLLPAGLRDAHPETVLSEAWLLHHRGYLPEIPALLARAEVLMGQRPLADGERLTLQAEIDALSSQLIYWTADAERVLTLTRRTLEMAPIEHSYVRSIGVMFAAAALQMRGEYADTIGIVHESLRRAKHDNPHIKQLLLTLCFMYWMAADLPRLLQTANHMLELGLEHSLSEGIAWANYFLGCARYQQNDLTAAESAFAVVVEHYAAAHGAVFRHSAYGLASVYQAQGLTEKARATIESLMRYTLRVNDPSTLAESEAFTAHLALSQGRSGEAAQWATLADRNIRAAPMPLFYVASFTPAEILLTKGTPTSLDEAARLLDRLHEIVQTTHNTRYLIQALALQALLHELRGERAAALESLKQAMTLAEPGGLIRVFVDLGPKMAVLLRQLRATGVASDFLDRVLAGFQPAGGAQPAADQSGLIEPLTGRELEVLTLLTERMSNKEIASTLYISPLTVKRHTSNIYQKLAVANRREAIARATALGILTPVAPRVLP